MAKELHQRIYSKDSADFGQMYSIYSEIASLDERLPEAMLVSALDDPNYKIITSKIDRNVVGFGIAKVHSNEFAVLEYFGVSQNFRRLGVGERLFQHMVYRILIDKKMTLLIKVEAEGSTGFSPESVSRTQDFFYWCGCRKIRRLDRESKELWAYQHDFIANPSADTIEKWIAIISK